jgi:hypothetical protein
MFWLPTVNNLDNNEIGIGQDCAATLGVMREIFTVASWSRKWVAYTLQTRQIWFDFYKNSARVYKV